MSSNKINNSVCQEKLVIVNYGPSCADVGEMFNVQADGSSAIWFEVTDIFNADLAVEFDGVVLKSMRNADVISAVIPTFLLGAPRIVTIKVVDEKRQHRSASVEFSIKGKTTNNDNKSIFIASESVSKPNFFMIGAPRSGTTSLYWRLRSHPNVYLSGVKEPYYFDERAYGTIKGAVVDKIDYQNLFKYTPYQAKVIGEASTVYLSSPDAIRKIRDYNSEAKILIVLRNPLMASVSLYLQHRKGGVYERAETIESAWEECEGDSSRPYIANYKDIYRIGDQLQDALNVFGRENLKVIIYDDLNEDSVSVYTDLLKYLHLKVDTHDLLPISNSAGWGDIRSIVSERLVKQMAEYFSPQIEIVSKSLGRNLDHWLDV